MYITIRQRNYENMLYMHGHYDHYKREIVGTVLETSRHPDKYDRGQKNRERHGSEDGQYYRVEGHRWREKTADGRRNVESLGGGDDVGR
jgi:hypothetical protein